MEADLVQMRPQCFYSAVIENLKLDYSFILISNKFLLFSLNANFSISFAVGRKRDPPRESFFPCSVVREITCKLVPSFLIPKMLYVPLFPKIHCHCSPVCSPVQISHVLVPLFPQTSGRASQTQ